MKPKHIRETGCPEALSSKCVTWNGPAIPCLDICNGDTLTDAVWAVADKVCTIAGDIDMTSLDLHCLRGLCDTCPEHKTLKTIIQLLLDNQCTLYDLINGGGISTDSCCDLTLNLRCLKKFDVFGNEIEQNLNQTLQSVVDELCNHRIRIEALEATVIDLQDQIDALDLTPYTEPTITICQSGTPKLLSAAVPIVAQDICDYKTVVGSSSDIQSAISKQCPGLNSTLGTVDGWILTPDNMAKSFNNLWIAYCNLLERVGTIEDTCCKVDCDSIEIHFQVNDNQDGDGVTIDFSSLYGNIIPTIFHDCGSTIVFTDIAGLTVSGRIIVAQESTSQEYDVSSLNLVSPLKISINAKLCSDTMTCVKCVSSEHTVVNGVCAACDVVITGSTGSVTIYYTVGISQDFITANVGDTVYIPKNAIDVHYTTNSGDAAPDTSCLVITESERICYVIDWEKPSGANPPLEDAGFTRLYLGTNEWGLIDGDAGGNYDGSAELLGIAINNLNSPMITASCFLNSGLNRYLLVSVIGPDIPKVRVSNPTGEGIKYMFIEGIAQDSCDCPVEYTAVGDGG